MKWILSQFRQASTWRGLVWLLTVFGLSLRPDQAEAIVMAGMALAGLLGVFLSDERTTPVERNPVGGAGDSAVPGADRVRDDLPSIELVGAPMGTAGRNSAAGYGVEHQRAVADRPAAELRQPMPTPDSARSYPTDPNTYPRFHAGFGDRD